MGICDFLRGLHDAYRRGISAVNIRANQQSTQAVHSYPIISIASLTKLSFHLLEIYEAFYRNIHNARSTHNSQDSGSHHGRWISMPSPDPACQSIPHSPISRRRHVELSGCIQVLHCERNYQTCSWCSRECSPSPVLRCAAAIVASALSRASWVNRVVTFVRGMAKRRWRLLVSWVDEADVVELS